MIIIFKFNVSKLYEEVAMVCFRIGLIFLCPEIDTVFKNISTGKDF
jgi:hypothetical protein